MVPTRSSAPEPTNALPFPFVLLAALVLTIAAGLLAIDADGFWLDEIDTRRASDKPNLATWLFDYWQEPSALRQVPLYQLAIYGWSRWFGLGEYALRVVNLVPYFAGLVAVGWALPRNRVLALCAIVIVGIHPLLWYYLDDARPYVLVYMSFVAACAGLHRWLTSIDAGTANRIPGLIVFGVASCILGMSHMLGLFWVVSLVGFAVFAICLRNGADLSRLEKLLSAVFGVVILVTGVYYAVTLMQGVRASVVGETNALTLGFVAYELLGIGGLGPGRLSLREGGVAVIADHLPLLLIGAACLGLGFLYGLRVARGIEVRTRLMLVLGLAFPTGLIVSAGYLVHWRVTGRHLIPVAAIVAFAMAYGLAALVGSRSPWRYIAGAALMATLIASGAGYKSQSHRSEDYRAAAQFAATRIEARETVWWFAEPRGAEIYGLALAQSSQDSCMAGQARVVAARKIRKTCNVEDARPDALVLSRPDVYDPTDAVSQLLTGRGYSPVEGAHGFQLWLEIDRAAM